MGLYDYFNGEQIKCFPVPFINENGYFGWSDGSLIEYQTGDTLPLKTFYYRYVDNLLFIDHNKEFEMVVCHQVKNGKLSRTIELNDLTEDVFSEIKNVHDSRGNLLNIHSVSELKKYLHEGHDLDKMRTESEKASSQAFEVYSELLKNFSKQVDVISEAYETYRKELGAHEERVQQLSQNFCSKWYALDEFEKEKKLGVYLYKLKTAAILKTELTPYQEDIRTFMKENSTIQQDYLKWLEPDKELLEELEEVFNILLNKKTE